MAYTGSPIITFNVEDGILVGCIVVIDALGSEFINCAVVKSQGSDREVVKVPLEIAVLET